jgi:hypothetical protein
MPAVTIRHLEARTKIIDHTSSSEQWELLLAQAAMILKSSEDSILEPADRAGVNSEYDAAKRAGALHPVQPAPPRTGTAD